MPIYNNGYPVTYQQYYPQYQPVANQQPQQIQNGGFVTVPNIETARNYPVALGTSVTFIDENAPYVYTKTRGFSQLEQPVFERLRLVKEEDAPEATERAGSTNPINTALDKLKAEYEALVASYDELRKDIDNLKAEWEGKQ